MEWKSSRLVDVVNYQRANIMENCGTRIKKLMQEKDISMRQLSRIAGVSHPSVAQWLKGEARPREKPLAAMAAYFNVPPGWILFGEDAPLAAASIDDGEYLTIPLLDQFAGCGNMVVSKEMKVVQMIKVARDWFKRKASSFSSLTNLHIIVATGDSMEPTICDGDFVVVDSGQCEIKADAVYSLCYGESVYLKRVQKHPNGHILLISDNSRYSPMELAEQDGITVVGRVVLAFNVHKI